MGHVCATLCGLVGDQRQLREAENTTVEVTRDNAAVLEPQRCGPQNSALESNQLSVKLVSGRALGSVTITCNTLLSELKQLIAEACGVPIERQCLMVGHVMLEDPHVYADTCGGDDITVVLLPDVRVLTGSKDKTAKLWSAVTGECVRTFEGHSSSIDAVTFSPAGTLVLTGSSDSSVKIWSATTGVCVRTLRCCPGCVSSVCFSPDGAWVLARSIDRARTCKVWIAATGECSRTFTGVLSAKFSPGSRRVLTGCSDGTAKVGSVVAGSMTGVKTFRGHSSYVRSVAFSADGTQVLTGSGDKVARLWNAETTECAWALHGHKDAVSSVAFSQDGLILLTGADDGSAKVWSAVTGECTNTLCHSCKVLSVAFSQDGTTVLTRSGDATVMAITGIAKLWDAMMGECTRMLQGHSGRINQVIFAPDGSLVLTGSDDNTAKLWGGVTGECVKSFLGHFDDVLSVALPAHFRYVPENLSEAFEAEKCSSGCQSQSASVKQCSKVDAAVTVNLNSFFWARMRGECVDPPLGYIEGFGVIAHEDTGIVLRCPPLQVGPRCSDSVLLYHYAPGDAFRLIVGNKTVKHLRASLAERAHFGDGVYACSKAPHEFGTKDAILANNYTNGVDPQEQEAQIQSWRNKGAVDFCIPLLVPKSNAINVKTHKTREMTRPGYTAKKSEPIRADRDVWVVVILDSDGKVQAANEHVYNIYQRLDSLDWSERLDAVEMLTPKVVSGDQIALSAILKMLRDEDHNVRAAALRALKDSKFFSLDKVQSEISVHMAAEIHPMVLMELNLGPKKQTALREASEVK